MSDAWSAYDRAQLAAPLAIDAGESCWYCFEGSGTGTHGRRRIAGLVWLHRTGPRIESAGLGISLVDRTLIPNRWRALVPAWLPLVAPFRIVTEDRALLMVAIHDLDAPDAQPRVVEVLVGAFDPTTCSATSIDGWLRLVHAVDELGWRMELDAHSDSFDLELRARARKPPVVFGDRGPQLRHGAIDISYAQRSRVTFEGRLRLANEHIVALVAEGAQDRHWRSTTEMNLRWLWLHLRMPDNRELNCYVIKDTRGDGVERGRGGWLIALDGRVTPLARFELRTIAEAPTVRGSVPSRFHFAVKELEIDIELAHATAAPFVPMRAFGALIVAGIYEAPIRVVRGAGEEIRGWLEVFDSSAARLRVERSH